MYNSSKFMTKIMPKSEWTLVMVTFCLLVVTTITSQDITEEPTDESGSSWDISWDREFSFTEDSQTSPLSNIFPQPGVILPGLDTISALVTIRNAISTNTTLEALGDLCTNFGPLLNYITTIILDDTGLDVQSICQPILKAVHQDTDLDGVSETCAAVWDATSGDEGGDDEDATDEETGDDEVEETLEEFEEVLDVAGTSKRRYCNDIYSWLKSMSSIVFV